MPPIVLITCGNGRAALHLIELLLSRPACPHLRVLVDADRLGSLKQKFPLLAQAPHAIFEADYMDAKSLTGSFRGVTTAIHNVPSVEQHEASMAIIMIEAAKSAGVGHFVLCSVLHPMRSKLSSHKCKLQIEEYLVESRMNYTIVRPTHYMQNVCLDHVLRTGKLPLGHSQSVEQGFLDLRDLSIVLRNIILDPNRHNKATYELVGENISYFHVAKLLQKLMKRIVECEVIPPGEYIEMMKRKNLIDSESEYVEDATERSLMYHNRWGLTGNSNVLRWLLGRQPRTWREYVTDTLRTHEVEEVRQADHGDSTESS